MNKGKITVESEDYKAIFIITQNDDETQTLHVKFKPELRKEANFVNSVVYCLVSFLSGDRK